MKEFRCNGTHKGKPCNRKLAEIDNMYHIASSVEIQCPKCGKKNII